MDQALRLADFTTTLPTLCITQSLPLGAGGTHALGATSSAACRDQGLRARPGPPQAFTPTDLGPFPHR